MYRKPLRDAQRWRLYTYIHNCDDLEYVGPLLHKYGFIKYEDDNLIKSVERGGAIAYNALRLFLSEKSDMFSSWLRTPEQNFHYVWISAKDGKLVHRSSEQYPTLKDCIEASPLPPTNTFIGAEDVDNKSPASRTPITFYQATMLKKCFALYEIMSEEVMDKMKGVIPKCRTQQDLLEAVLNGGSLAFNGLVEAVRHPSFRDTHPESWYIDHALMNHCIPEKFRWVWIWTYTGEIMMRSDDLYSNRRKCEQAAAEHKPKWPTLPGHEPPRAVLAIESICSCYENLPPGSPFPEEHCKCSLERADQVETRMYSGFDMVGVLPELMDN